MGVSFTWEFVGPVEEHSFASGSSLNSALEECFGALPVILTRTAVPRLEGIKACGFADIEELISAIYEHEQVRVKAHW